MPEVNFDAVSTAILDDHEIRLFYEIGAIDITAGPNLTMGDIAKAARGKTEAVPNDQHAALSGRYSEASAWAELGTQQAATPKWKISSDLHPSIQDLLGGKKNNLARLFGLTPIAENFLNRAALYEKDVAIEDREEKNLTLSFRAAAIERIQKSGVTPCKLAVSLSNISVISFATGLSFCCVSVQLTRADNAPLSAVEFAEGLYAFSRQNNLQWHSATAENETISEQFSLGQLLRLLAEGAINPKIPSQRAETFAHVSFAEHQSTENLDIMAAYLARRYNSDYAFDIRATKIEFLKDFTNIRHAVSTEAAATVLSPHQSSELPSYLQGWRTDAFASSYARLFLLALHEDRFLTKSRALSADDEQEDKTVEELEDLVEEALVFRLCFRFFGVSKLSMHTEFSHALRKMRFLDRKLEEFEGDVSAASERLQANYQAHFAAKEQTRYLSYSLFATIGGAFLAGLTALTIAQELLAIFPDFLVSPDVPEAMANPDMAKTVESASAPDQESGFVIREQIPLIIGFFVSLFTVILGLKYRPSAPDPNTQNRLSFRAMTLRMMRRALR